jgi:hypothetical protein
MKTGEKARAKGNADPGAAPESVGGAGQITDPVQPSPHFGAAEKGGASLTGPPPRDVLAGKSCQPDKIIDGPNNSD